MRGYNVVTRRIGTNIPVPGKGCAYIEFINQGDNIVMVDDVAILPWGSWAPVPPLPGEADYSQYRVKFITPSSNMSLVVVQKFYNDAV